MIRISLRQSWKIDGGEVHGVDERLVQALAAIEATGSINQAALKLHLSYRFLWGLLLRWGQLLGAPLVILQRGKGATLTPVGEKLLWADKRITARLSPLLDSLASELEVELQRVLAPASGVVRIHASHGFAVEALREDLTEASLPVDLKYMGSQEALASLAQSGCDLAGFHVPIGDLQAAALRHYATWLQAPGFALINLAMRQQGLIVAPGNPKGIAGLRDLQREDVRFVNRQQGSGTRMLLDIMLDRDRIKGDTIKGYEVSEYTHAAVAAYVASGMADVGFGIETGARRFGLDFIPMAAERYFLICHQDRLHSKPIEQVLTIMQSRAFEARVDLLPGYNAKDCGEVMTIDAAFPSLGRGAGGTINSNRARRKAAVSSAQPAPRKRRQKD